jgi:hypothetical protein
MGFPEETFPHWCNRLRLFRCLRSSKFGGELSGMAVTPKGVATIAGPWPVAVGLRVLGGCGR